MTLFPASWQLFDHNIVHLHILYRLFQEPIHLRTDMQIFKDKIRKQILTVFFLDIEIRSAITHTISHTDMIGLRYGFIRPSLQVEELRPGIHVQEILNVVSLNIFHRNIFIMLRRIWSKL